MACCGSSRGKSVRSIGSTSSSYTSQQQAIAATRERIERQQLEKQAVEDKKASTQ